ncbi:hypothetical protein [Kineococcus sp. SYSU DK018]|uniref:hypothetical protein n=1 Tax=Kineococcus sp. SYSU DK018 TaxID=3383139 RepID=UPI003D7CB87D
MQQRRREARGKGMRSVLHAAFTVALSEFCTERELPHPGFIALDTPVLTYRDAAPATGDPAGPEDSTDPTSEELLSSSVAQAFYRYLADDHTGQAIVLENQTPPTIDAPDCAIEYFSGTADSGRAGFYPVPD